MRTLYFNQFNKGLELAVVPCFLITIQDVLFSNKKNGIPWYEMSNILILYMVRNDVDYNLPYDTNC